MPFGSWWMKQNTHLLAQVAISPARGRLELDAGGRRRAGARAVARAGAGRSTLTRGRSSPPWNEKSMASRSAWPLMATDAVACP